MMTWITSLYSYEMPFAGQTINDKKDQKSMSKLYFSKDLFHVVKAMYTQLPWLCNTVVDNFMTEDDLLLNGISPSIVTICYMPHWGQDKMVNISQMTFSNAFSLKKMYEFRLIFHWSFFLRVRLTIFHHYTPRFNEIERVVYWFHLVCLSVCPSVDRIVSARYLQQYLLVLSSNFGRCVTCTVCFKI